MWRRFISLTLLLGLIGNISLGAQSSHQDVVAKWKTILLSQGENLSGPCGAFKITSAVAWELRGEGWGLVHSSGNGCALNGDLYRADTIMQPNGYTVDILSLSESNNGDTSNNNAFNLPVWGQTGNQDPSSWRVPFQPTSGGSTPLPLPGPPPAPSPGPVVIQPAPIDLSGVYARLADMVSAEERQYLDLSSQNKALAAQNTALADQLKAHDEKTSKFIAFFTDGKTISTIIGIVGGYFANRAVNQ